ncbi:hypothetical protein H112_08784 [Trichophyton rubrum D6]|uniref:Uncharacterized protein n=4 Tax=Trichophyton TaxID=5550 RepID=A0A178ERS4_TRIRU|nr:uncharacterized protein TERG_01332 [Trichophyton rubrum CBS 118892]EZF09912.1 hypothetical protein H100_08805 [Trichophyton rubrum MR850]EZF36765.1 hypothetical protein H102_08765 [Trichophyton rubrum CBS 100081]EZF47366.1 hypothetical protein H103_08787 [Trichophyton rubrum CBS 288.86]EZF57933.1 hypothetical protein H104_08736 [Trichophyton rubrum CBS 289.86]EZF68581.1 hypothetical protein H105_08790 [Trichophyton soudanense CBS 452.61]EZF79335.1 hypothetical protein H110_08789 [Trichophy
MFRFHKTLDIITLFHKPTLASSTKALSVLQRASTAIKEGTATSPSGSLLRNSDFELNVTEEPPTTDQLKLIMDYMTSSPLASGGIGVGKPGDLVSGATDRSDAVKRLKENGDSFIRPVVVDWNNGKAVLATSESAILKLLSEET